MSFDVRIEFESDDDLIAIASAVARHTAWTLDAPRSGATSQVVTVRLMGDAAEAYLRRVDRRVYGGVNTVFSVHNPIPEDRFPGGLKVLQTLRYILQKESGDVLVESDYIPLLQRRDGRVVVNADSDMWSNRSLRSLGVPYSREHWGVDGSMPDD